MNQNTAIEERLRPHLTDGERVTWTGQPKGRLPGLAPQERAPAILSLGWFGITSYALLWALDREVGAAVALAMVLVPGVFLFINARRLIQHYRERSERAYAITTERVWWLARNRVNETIPVADITEVSVHHHGNGSGTVVLGPTSRTAEVLRQSSARARGRAVLAPALEELEDAEAVYRLLRARVGV